MNTNLLKWVSPIPNLTLRNSTDKANFLTKLGKIYYTSIKIDGFWYVTNKFDPRVK